MDFMDVIGKMVMIVCMNSKTMAFQKQCNVPSSFGPVEQKKHDHTLTITRITGVQGRARARRLEHRNRSVHGVREDVEQHLTQ